MNKLNEELRSETIEKREQVMRDPVINAASLTLQSDTKSNKSQEEIEEETREEVER